MLSLIYKPIGALKRFGSGVSLWASILRTRIVDYMIAKLGPKDDISVEEAKKYYLYLVEKLSDHTRRFEKIKLVAKEILDSGNNNFDQAEEVIWNKNIEFLACQKSMVDQKSQIEKLRARLHHFHEMKLIEDAAFCRIEETLNERVDYISKTAFFLNIALPKVSQVRNRILSLRETLG